MFNFHIKTHIIYGVFGFWSIAEIIHYIRVRYFIYPKLNLIKNPEKYWFDHPSKSII